MGIGYETRERFSEQRCESPQTPTQKTDWIVWPLIPPITSAQTCSDLRYKTSQSRSPQSGRDYQCCHNILKGIRPALPVWAAISMSGSRSVMDASHQPEYPRALTTLLLQPQTVTGLSPLPPSSSIHAIGFSIQQVLKVKLTLVPRSVELMSPPDPLIHQTTFEIYRLDRCGMRALAGFSRLGGFLLHRAFRTFATLLHRQVRALLLRSLVGCLGIEAFTIFPPCDSFRCALEPSKASRFWVVTCHLS